MSVRCAKYLHVNNLVLFIDFTISQRTGEKKFFQKHALITDTKRATHAAIKCRPLFAC